MPIFHSDASRKGWGSVLEDASIGGRWTPSEAANRINHLEMHAVFLTLRAFSTFGQQTFVEQN